MKIIDVKIKLTAVKVLIKEIGFLKLMKVAPALPKGAKNGEPFGKLPAPQDEKDVNSRKLIAEAILLYRELLKIYPQPKAEEIIRKVILESAITQLKCLIPKLKKEKLIRLSEEERTKYFCGIISKFPNTDWRLVKGDTNHVHISISRCRLVELFDSVGHPELRDSCCTGDIEYFKRRQKEIVFDRDGTIGEGCQSCEFHFKLNI